MIPWQLEQRPPPSSVSPAITRSAGLLPFYQHTTIQHSVHDAFLGQAIIIFLPWRFNSQRTPPPPPLLCSHHSLWSPRTLINDRSPWGPSPRWAEPEGSQPNFCSILDTELHARLVSKKGHNYVTTCTASWRHMVRVVEVELTMLTYTAEPACSQVGTAAYKYTLHWLCPHLCY